MLCAMLTIFGCYKWYSEMIADNSEAIFKFLQIRLRYNHRIVESQNSLGCKRLLKVTQSKSPAKNRDIFNQMRMFQALHTLTMNVSRDGASTTALGTLCQYFATLIM